MRVLVRFSLGFGAGTLVVLLLLSGSPLFLLGLVLAVPGILLCRRDHGLGPVLLGLCGGLLWTGLYQTRMDAPMERYAGQTLEISGEATDFSTPTAYGLRVPAKVAVEGRTVHAQLWLYEQEPLSPGDRFTATARLEAPAGEYESMYRAEGIRLLAYGKKDARVTRLEAIPSRYLPRRMARALEDSLQGAVPEDALGYATALTTGNRDLLTSYEKETLKASGIYHAMALSGMHLTVLMGLAALLIRRRRYRALLGIPLCVAFTLVTGAGPSILRAAIMQCLLLLAPLVRREEDAPTSLGAAGLLMLLQNPWCILGWGTQLSFASMAGLLLLGEPLRRWLEERLPGPNGPLRTAVLGSLTATYAATAGALPLMLAHFGYLSLVSPVTNLLTGWAVSWCFRGSLLTALAGLASPLRGRALGWVLAWLIRYVRGVAGLLSRAPFATVRLGVGCGILVAAFLYLLLFLLFGGRRERAVLVSGVAVLTALSLCIGVSAVEDRAMALTMLDTGDGRSLILTRSGRTLVVDCGGKGESAGDLTAGYLGSLGRTRVDVLVLTGSDPEASAGAAELLRRIRVEQILLPGDGAGFDEAILETAAAGGTEVRYVRTDQSLTVGGETLRLLPEGNGMDLLLEGDLRALIPGSGAIPRAAAGPGLLVGGRDIPLPLLEKYRPETVLSSGEDLDGDALDWVRAAGTRLLSVEERGTITIKGA